MRREPLAYPFASAKEAAAYAVVLGVALLLPIGASLLGPPDRPALYASLPTEAGPVAFLHQELFESDGDIDMLFLGSSTLWAGVDTPLVRDKLSQRLGREATVLSFGTNYRYEDINYVLLRDLLVRRKVKTLVWSPPPDWADYSGPHPFASYWLTIEDDPRVMKGLPALQMAQVYAANVLGAPRRLLSMLRPDRLEGEKYTESFGALLAKRGWLEATYVRGNTPPPAFTAQAATYSPRTADRWRFLGIPLTPYQSHFVRRLGQLVQEHNLHLVALTIPFYSGLSVSAATEERLFWPDVLGQPLTLVGLPPAELFAGRDQTGIKRLFYNAEHFNETGATFFTRAVLSALLETHFSPELTRTGPGGDS